MQRHVSNLIPFSRNVLASALALGRQGCAVPITVDATAGNGHDTLFLATESGERGDVWAFDVQKAAVDATRERIAHAGFANRVHVVHAGHETIRKTLPPDAAGRIYAATFNLGYLPGSDKTIITTPTTTLTALDDLASMFAVHGVLSVHAYQGHPGGEEEGVAVCNWFRRLPWSAWRVAEYSFFNKIQNRETLFLAEKIA